VTTVRTRRFSLASAGRTSSTWRLKKLLASAIVLGAVGSITVGGAYGMLNSEGTNTGSTVASGTLTLSNVVGTTGTTCFSYGASSTSNVNNTCQALFVSTSENYPGTPATAKVTITNNGSLDATDLSVYMPSCASATTPGAPSPGGANLCGAGGAQFYVQETDAAGTPTKCWFPSGTTCAFAANSLFVFATNDNATSSGLDLGSGPTHAAARYFVIGMQLAANALNTLQGQAALFSLTWHVTT
jgi:hypothetical protein